jgi:hypothetical protein
MDLFQAVKEFFANFFSKNPQEVQKKRELKRIVADLQAIKPSIYRYQDKTVLPGFAAVIMEFCQLLRPVADLLKRTVSHTDVRTSQRFRDMLIDAKLPPDARDSKQNFAYDAMSSRIDKAADPDEEMEILAREFQSFIKHVEMPDVKALDVELADLERLVDICRNDYERILGLFDPSANLDNPAYRPQFSPANGAQLAPELIDLFYLIADFSVSVKTEENLSILLGRLTTKGTIEPEQKKKLDKVLVNVNKLLKHQLNAETLLNLLRAVKEDPAYMPSISRESVQAVDAYRTRIITQFQKDRERILRERHENAIMSDIKALFGSQELLSIGGYDEDNNELLQRESPNSFNYVKPMRILKTYLQTKFDGPVRDSTKRVLIEGYFDNKALQNSFANVYYQCEKSSDRLNQFEMSVNTPGRTSVLTMRRYVDEIRKGKDMTLLLNKLVDTINNKARDILDLEANLYFELANCMFEIVADYKKSTPEIISNIRTLGAGKNKELITFMANGYNDMVKFVKIMKNFTIIRAAANTAVAIHTDKESASVSDVEEI